MWYLWPEASLLSHIRVWSSVEPQDISVRLEHCVCTLTLTKALGFLFSVCLCVDGFEPTAMFPKVPSGEYVEGTEWDAFMMTSEGEF